ncbi:murein hydrolase activator EnvC family protein [Micromonospora sp. NPDC048930]|uniref:murein hydrolase activator EnvC family protein n=1 Tax=Micromonospora sp. NPDC048930 TaxID=3364261 RepID=UPI003723AAC3
MRNLLRRLVPVSCALVLVVPVSVEPASAGPAPSGRAAAGLAAGGPATRFRWPLAGTPRPVRRFDPPPQPWLPGHRGVDLAAGPGTAVHAAGPGVVLFAGPVAGRPVVTVGHADGLRTTYEPVRPGLPAGARVDAGTPIGTLLAGHPGCPTAACLHWGLRRGEEYLDPLALLGLGPVRLLPLDPDDLTPPGAAPGGVGSAPGVIAGADVAPGVIGGAAADQAWASSAGRPAASRSYSSGLL